MAVKVKENYTVDQSISNWLRSEFSNKSEAVNQILKEAYEKSIDSYQKIQEIDRKIAKLDEEREIILIKIERKKKEADLQERKKAKKFLKEQEKITQQNKLEMDILIKKIKHIILKNNLILDFKNNSNLKFVAILKKSIPESIHEIDSRWDKALRIIREKNLLEDEL